MMSISRSRGIVSAPTTVFIDTFSSTENPLSEGGIYSLGGTTGLDWQNVRTTGGSPGICYGVGSSPGPPYNDCIATVQARGFSTTKFFSEITASKTGGYTPPDSHELEVLFMYMAANSVVGYEMDFGFGQGVQPVRWNGAINDFTINGEAGWPDAQSGTAFAGGLADGDVAKFVFDSTSGHPVITGYLNGSQVFQVADTSAGKISHVLYPGFGFFARAGTGLDLTKFCIKGFRAGDA